MSMIDPVKPDPVNPGYKANGLSCTPQMKSNYETVHKGMTMPKAFKRRFNP